MNIRALNPSLVPEVILQESLLALYLIQLNLLPLLCILRALKIQLSDLPCLN